MLGKSEGNKKFKTSVRNLPQYSMDLPVDMAYRFLTIGDFPFFQKFDNWTFYILEQCWNLEFLDCSPSFWKCLYSSVYNPKHIVLYTCGHGSNWNTWIRLFCLKKKKDCVRFQMKNE